MSDRPGEPKARESAAAVRDAAAALRSPESQAAIRGFLGTADAEPTDVDADAPGGQEDEPEPAAEPTKEPEADDDEPGTDYDPEDAAEYPDDEEEPPEQPPGREPPEPTISEDDRALLGRYDTDEKRLEALRELERLRTGGPPAPPTSEPEPAQPRVVPRPGVTPSNQDLNTILREMSEQDPSIQQAIDELAGLRTTLEEDAKQRSTHDQAVNDAQTAVRDLESIVAYTKKKLERIPEDDLAARQTATEELDSIVRELHDARFKFNEARQAKVDFENENGGRRAAYAQGIERLRNIGTEEYTGRAQRDQEERARKTEYDSARKEKEAALPRVMKKLRIPESMQQEFREDIGAAADRLSDEQAMAELAPGRIESWMEKVGQGIKKKYDRYAHAALRQYVENKSSDAAQPAPRDPKTGPRRDRERALTAREADREAARTLRTRLGAR